MDRLIALLLLRLRMEMRALTRARERAAGLLLLLPVLLVFSGVGSLFAFMAVRSLESARPEAVAPLLSFAATAIGLFWSLSPLLSGVALSETHDLSRLLHFPVPLPVLAASSLLANLAQPLVLAAIPVLLSVALALADGAAWLPFSLAGLLVTFLLVLAIAQTVGLVLQGLARNRRLHDLSLLAGLAFGFAISLLPLLVLAGGARTIGGAMRWLRSSRLLELSPFAWGVRAAVFGGRGELVPFLLHGAAALGAVGLALALSTVLIQRIYRGELDLAGGFLGGGERAARMILPGTLGALVEKDLRAAWREPALKAMVLMGLVSPLLFLFVVTRMRVASRSGVPLLLLASFVGLSGFGANAFGFERRGIGLLMGFPVARWRILVGKNIVALLLRSPAALTLLAAAVLIGPLAYLPAALTIALVTLLLVAGADNYMSVLFPAAMPGPGKSPYAGPSAGGRGLAGAALGALVLMAALMVASPFVFLVWLPLLLRAPGLWLFTLPLALTGAGSVYAMLVAGAASLLARREPELLERILEEA